MAKQSALRDDGSTALWRKIRSRVLTRDQHTCQRCGLEATHVDHIIPRRLGGDDGMDNLQALCKPCNLSKGGGFLSPIPSMFSMVCHSSSLSSQLLQKATSRPSSRLYSLISWN